MIAFSPPYIDDDVINEVLDSLRSGWITTGPKVKALEKEVSEEIACERSRYGCPGTNVPALPRSDQQHT